MDIIITTYWRTFKATSAPKKGKLSPLKPTIVHCRRGRAILKNG